LKEIIIANARYWLDYLQALPRERSLSPSYLQGIAKAISAVATIPEAWDMVCPFVSLLHPYMEYHGHWADWESFLHHLVHLAQQHNDQEAQIIFLMRLSVIQRQRGNYQAATASFVHIWRICRHENRQLQRAIALSNLGVLYRLQGYFWRAEVTCRSACDLFKSLGDSTRLAYTENTLGLIDMDQHCWTEAMVHFEYARTLFGDMGDAQGQALVQQNLGILYNYMHQSQKSLDNLQQTLGYYQQTENNAKIAITQLNISNALLSSGDLPGAEQFSLQAETNLKQLGDNINLARTRHNLGMIYTKTGNWDEAEQCFHWALDHWRLRQDIRNTANTLSELTSLYLAWGKWLQAQACLDEAKALIQGQEENRYQTISDELQERQLKLVGLKDISANG